MEPESSASPRGPKVRNEADSDKFATLFSPATPRASPTLEHSEMRTAAISHPQMYHPNSPGSNSEFGAFVSVPATEDPLASFDFEPPKQTLNAQPQQELYTRAESSTLRFFDKFAKDAKLAAERNKRGVLEELLLHEDDPLYWIKEQEVSGLTTGPVQSTSEDKPTTPEPSASSIHDVEEEFFTTKTQTEQIQSHPSVSHPKSPSRSPTLPSPPTLAPPIADTSLASSTPTDELTDPLSTYHSTRPSSPPRSNTYNTISSLSSRWMSSILPTSKSAIHTPHTSTPSVESLFAFETASMSRRARSSESHPPAPEHAPTVPPTQISHGTPFGRSTKASPFASHPYTPPTGAPGFKGDRYDWDKGFSAELERELGEGEDRAEREMVDVDSRVGDKGTVRHGGVGQLIEKMTGGVELNGRRVATTPVLDVSLADMIRPHLPALARLPRQWILLYSLDQHGISLNTLFSRCEAYMQPKPGTAKTAGVLVVMKDAGDGLFGVWMGEDGVRLSKGKGYYGSGESFMWKYIGNKFQVFKWTGKNDYVALCEPEFISFGGGDGHYGLYLDESLFEGSSARCPTFENEPLCSAGPNAAGTASFECVGLEVWGVGP